MRFLVLVLVPVLGAVWSVDVTAQGVPRATTVSERERSEFDPTGIQLGGLRLFPALGVEYRSDSNIFATAENEIEDSIWVGEPSLILRSDWSRHAFEVGTRVNSARHDEVESEDYDDSFGWVAGRVDLNRQQISAHIEQGNMHEERTSPNDQGGIVPTEFVSDSFSVSYRYQPAQFFFTVDAYARQLDYKDTLTLAGRENNDDRDETNVDVGVRVGHEVSDSYSLFAEARSNSNEYDQLVDDDGFARSSDGYEVLLGATVDLSGSTYGEIHLGYRETEYDDERFQTVDGFTFDLDFIWNVSGLTSIQLSGGREINSTTIVGVSGIEATSLDLAIEHELRRNLILRFDASLLNEKFQGSPRDDSVRAVGLNAEYMVNRRLSLFLGLEAEGRETSPLDAGGFEYSKRWITLRLEGRI
ncbi:MAG TPA: outer membrane beta-barrel protein [Gammaproteobacteria bacterium]